MKRLDALLESDIATHVRCTLLLTAVVCLQPMANSQLPPSPPISPTSSQECQAFSRNVEQYFGTILQRHEACLAANKADRPNEQPGSAVCSRTTCQSLHDKLYGSFGRTLKSERDEVAKCNATVNDYLKQQALEKQREADRKQAEERKRESEKKQEQAPSDRDAKLKLQAEDKKKAGREAQERQAGAAKAAQEAQRHRLQQELEAAQAIEEARRLQIQQEAERVALANQIARHRSQTKSDPGIEQHDKQTGSNGEQLAQAMNSDPFRPSRDGRTDTSSGTNVRSIINGPDPFAGAQSHNAVGSKAEAPTIAAVSRSITQYIQSAGEAWKSLKGESRFSEPLSLASDSLKMARTASAGDVPSTIPLVEKLDDYVDKEGTALDTLAHKSTQDWVISSGINSFDRSTIPTAQGYLDNLSRRLATIQRLNQELLPSLEAAKNVLENPAVDATRMAVANSTLPGLDSIALGDVVARLNGCSSQIDQIQSRIRLARAAVY